MGLPGLGAILEVVPVFARKPLFAYPLAVLSFITIGVLSFMVWAHHMFVSGMAEFFHIPIMLTTELISVPTGIVFLAALGTIWMGRIHFKVPMLWVFGFIWAFLIGGITGVYLADVPTDIALSDTYFVVAHFHYTIVGGTIYGLFAGTYYWFPKITGRMYNERLGQLHFWWFTLAFNATFLPMFWLGIEGMRRRVADYPPRVRRREPVRQLRGAQHRLSVAVFVFNMVRSWRRGPSGSRQPVARADPRVADRLAAADPELRAHPHRHRRALRVRRVAGVPAEGRAGPMTRCRSGRADTPATWASARRIAGRGPQQHAARRQARHPVRGDALRRALRGLLRDPFGEPAGGRPSGQRAPGAASCPASTRCCCSRAA